MENNNVRTKRFLIVLFIIAIAAVVTVLSLFIKNAIDKAIYSERSEALYQLVNTSARSINNNTEMQWEIAKVYENDLLTHLHDYKSPLEYLEYLNSQMSDKDDYYFLVDSIGKYYCTDGESGKITNTDFFTESSPDSVEYLDSLPHVKDGKIYLILRTRLEEPVTLHTDNGAIDIVYCALMHDVTSLFEHISSLFDCNNNTMIYDTDTGRILYKQLGIRLLVEGYNVYSKYQVIDLAYGADPDEIISDIKAGRENVSLMKLENESFYICSTPLDISNWSLLLVVEGAFFNSSSKAAFSGVINSITVILLSAAVLAVVLIWYLSKLNLNKRLLENEQVVNAALNNAYKAKSNFLSYMSHDIRTPINGMIGLAKIGMENSGDSEKAEECFKKIDMSSKHLLAIVNDVLDMSAIESGKIVIANDKMDIEDTVKGCLDIIKGTLSNRNLKIKEAYNCSVRQVMGDEFHLKQIIINILSNAVKFTEDGGTITVSLRQLNEINGSINYRISISDTGIGMSEEFKEHIFEAFKTAAPDGKTKYKGSGLGMAIVNEYVNLMHGTITVDSKLNEGSTFTVVLPFEKAAETSKDIDLKDISILLVDDNEINRDIAEDLLTDRVKKLTLAKDGKEVYEIYASSKPNEYDVILMDLEMPVMNGYDATRAIRSTPRSDSNIVIYALTANTYKDEMDSLYEAGMNGFLNKPLSVNQLVDKLKGRG